MDRLTEKYRNGDGSGISKGSLIDRPGKGYPSSIALAIVTKLADYEDLEEQGLLLRLPCKVGDTVYRINKGAKNPVIIMRVLQVHIKQLHKNRTIIRIDTINDEDMGEGRYLLDDLGKTVFLTKEEAEQKLKEMESDNNV